MKWKQHCNVSTSRRCLKSFRIIGKGEMSIFGAQDEDEDATLHASLHQQRQSWSLSAQTSSEVASPSTQTAERQQKQRNGPLEQVATI